MKFWGLFWEFLSWRGLFQAFTVSFFWGGGGAALPRGLR